MGRALILGSQNKVALAWVTPWLIATAGLPILAVVIQALANPEGASAVLTGRTLELFLDSLFVGGMVTMLSLVFGVPLGVVLGLGAIPRGRFWLAVHVLPVFLPPFLLTLGWFHLLGREGIFGSEHTSAWFFGRPGLVFVLTATLMPLITLCTVLGVRSVEPTLVAAGRISASPLMVAARIVVPLAWPAIAVGALLVFTLTFAEVAVPMFLRVQVYPATVLARLGGLVFAPAEAAVLALPVVLLALFIVAVERIILHRSADIFSTLGGNQEPLRFRGAAWFPCLLVAGGVILSSAPLAALFVHALQDHGFADAWSRLGVTAGNSVGVGVAAATVATVIAVVVGHGLARGSKFAVWLDALALTAFLVPGAVTGVGVILTWNRPATAWIYGTMAILPLCLIGRYAVIAIRVFSAGVRQIPASHEEAAAVGGVGYFRRLTGVVIPESGRSFVAAWLLCLVFCLRDVETAILVYPPGGETLPVRIFTLEANGPTATVAALSLFHVAITVVALAALAVVVRIKRITT